MSIAYRYQIHDLNPSSNSPPRWSSDTVFEDSREARTGLREKKRSHQPIVFRWSRLAREHDSSCSRKDLKRTARSTSTYTFWLQLTPPHQTSPVMRMRRSLGLMVLPLIRAETSKPNTGDQLQGFTFGYTTSNLVLPVISTCPTPLTISALNPTNAGGPDPIAPYTMVMFVHEQLMDGAGIAYERIYSRSMNIGDMSQSRQFQHPWMSGTQFIGCVWSQNGVSGGCQVSSISTS